MKPFIVLLVSFITALLVTKLITGRFEMALPARVAMAAMIIFTAMGHFMFTRGMTMMVPDIIPFKKELVYVTGIVEIVAAIALLIPSLRVAAGWFLICFFVLLLPANINAAIKHIDYQKANFDGNGPLYLWFRVPLQVLFIVWTYFSAVRY